MRLKRTLMLGIVMGLLLMSVGCAKEAEEPALEPKIAPPAISEAGVLRAGVDLEYPPFAGKVDGSEAGLDVDIAAAIAERLGLRLELVDTGADGAAKALEDGDIDIALGALAITDAVLSDVTFAGSYLVDGPAFFSYDASASADASAPAITVGTADLIGMRVGVQEGSESFWKLDSEFGEGFATAYPDLQSAFDALDAGDLDVVVADAAVGAYIARDHAGVAYAGQYGAGRPLGVAIDKDAVELESAVRETLDALVAEGVLDTIKAKWLGVLPVLETVDSGL